MKIVFIHRIVALYAICLILIVSDVGAACNLADGSVVQVRTGEYYTHSIDARLPTNRNEQMTGGQYVSVNYNYGTIYATRISTVHYYTNIYPYGQRSSCGGGGGLTVTRQAGGLIASLKNTLTLFGIIDVSYNSGTTQVLQNQCANLSRGLRAQYALDDVYVRITYTGTYYAPSPNGGFVWSGTRSKAENHFVKGSFLKYRELCCQECIDGTAH